MECIPSPSSRHVEISMSWSDEVFFYLAERTPWHSFTQVIHSLNTNGSLQLLFPSSREASGCQQGSFNSMDASNELEVVHGLGNSFLTRWLDDILFAFHITDLVESSIPVECINPRPYLPPKEGLPDIDVEAITDLSTKSTQLEFLKLAAHLLSNNFDVAHVSSVIVELAQDKRNRALLRSLLDQKLLVADAMAEKLLIPAVRGKNIPLINLLLEADCDINMETLLPGLGNPSSALECATAQNSEDIVTFLLDNGANGNVPRRLVISYGLGVYVWFESLLDAAVYRGNISMARELLKPRPKFRHGCPKITIDTFRIAMVSNKIETILFLLKRDPTLNELIRSQPWSFLEVAALQKTSSLFSHLEQYGLDINQTDNLGMGSPLAAASASGNLTLVRHLCERNASLSSVNSRLPQALLTPLSFSYSGKCSLGSLGGMAALHTAICNQDEQMVEFLLSKGAEINQCCYPEDTYGTHLPVFPIQLATYYENTVIVNMLLDAGADPDATMGPTLGSTVGIIKVHGFIQITGRSALRIALERGNEIIFDRLLQCGAIMPTDPTHVDSWDPLISASRGGNPNLLRRIFKVSKLKNDTIHISLTECILHFDSGLAKKMLRSLELSSVPSKYIYRRDVIRAAVESGDADLVHSLLKNAKASMGRLPAGYGATGFVAAMRNRHFGMISLFLSVGIKPYDVDVDEYELEERDALAVAIGGTDEPTIPPEQLELLINASTEPITGSHEHDLWRSSLFFACKWAIVQYPEFLSMIVAKGINVNWAPPGDNTLLQYAIQCSAIHLRIEHTNDQSPLEFLLHCGADIHAPASYSHGATALQYAAMKGNFEILNKLLKAGANINEPCGLYQGRTAIEGAAEHGRLNMVSKREILRWI
jgi:ankyrin repeat protein